MPSEKKKKNNTSPKAKTKKTIGNSNNARTRHLELVPLTAIGASAGGLEPIETFFDVMPPNTGCAFVIIQHLSPDFRSLMDELLARHSNMIIHRAVDGMKIEPNAIYLNSPRAVMTVHGNHLRLEEITSQDMVYLPINLFFDSMAQSRGSDSIAIVFSGTGTDGTHGAQSICAVNGKVLVQDPLTTRFDGMPKSVIDDGSYDLVASPRDLASSVLRLLKKESLDFKSFADREPIEEPLQDLFSMLKHRYGTDFQQYKESTVKRRIERRAQINRIADINDYRDLLKADEIELEELYADLLIEVTEFFRDPEAFGVLRNQILPQLMENCKDGDAIRVWVPGCASGEEAYSIAILLREQARVMGINLQLKILATDIHIRSMNKASAGIYSEESLAGVPADLVSRYFDTMDGEVQIKSVIRNLVFFSTHDVMRDPPFTRIDLVSCRNLLIYLNDDAQEKVINLLHFALRKDGYLFLGPSEHIGAIAHEFVPVMEKWRFYQKRRDIKLLPAESIFERADLTNGLPAIHVRPKHPQLANHTRVIDEDTISQKRAQRVALEEIVSEFAPPGFLLTDDGSVVHIFGKAGALLPMRSGSFSKNIVDLIRPELKVVISAALDTAQGKDFREFKRSSYIKNEEQGSMAYEIILKPMELSGEAQRFLRLSIQEKIKIDSGTSIQRGDNNTTEESVEELNQQVLSLEQSLRSSEESLQSTIEELETSNEELQSTNEELMSTNEELQSTNEELHSVNEELYTVSAEHQRKNQELTERDNDLSVLLGLSKIGTVHLDDNLNLLRFTSGARNVFNIMPQDVGRPFAHISMVNEDQDVHALIEEVKQAHSVREIQLKCGKSEFLVRILPHEKDNDFRRGVLLTVIDISDLQMVRSELENLSAQYKDIVENTGSFIVRWSAKSRNIIYCNDLYAARWGKQPAEIIGSSVLDLRLPNDVQDFIDIESRVTLNNSFTGVFTTQDLQGRKRSSRVNTQAISANGVDIDHYQTIGNDCTEEINYLEAVDELSKVFASEVRDPESKLKEILTIGLNYYELDTAVISSIIGNSYTVKTLVSHVPMALASGTTLDIGHTMCGQFIDRKASFAIDDVANSTLKSTACYAKTGIESFVGAAVQTAEGPFGAVSFSSTSPRNRKYTAVDESFSLLIAGWVGYLLGNVEQLEFMAKQNEYYKTLFQTVPTMMFLCDEEGLILSASDLFSKQVGELPEHVPGKNCLQFFDEADVEHVRSTRRKGQGSAVPAKLLGANESLLEVELNLSIKLIGTLQGIRMVIVTDVSPRNQASREAAEKNRSLELANESLNQFAFIASHDLQEPLRKIQQFSSFLEEDLGGALDDEGHYHLRVIVEASQRMSTLIHDLLSFSGTTKIEALLEELPLGPLVKSVIDDIEFPDDSTGVAVNYDELPLVQGHKPLLTQLFTNLISNSIKYRSPKRPLAISINIKSLNDKPVIELTDNGIGFDIQFAKKIFEPFNRLHSNKQFKGNGIGLAICQTVCEKHGWTITAEGVHDEGCKFIITM